MYSTHSAINVTIWLYLPHMLKMVAQEVEYVACFCGLMSRWLVHAPNMCRWGFRGRWFVLTCKRPRVLISDWKRVRIVIKSANCEDSVHPLIWMWLLLLIAVCKVSVQMKKLHYRDTDDNMYLLHMWTSSFGFVVQIAGSWLLTVSEPAYVFKQCQWSDSTMAAAYFECRWSFSHKPRASWMVHQLKGV